MRRGVMIGVAAIVALVLAPAASAAPHHRHAPVLPVLRVHGTRGYTIDVYADVKGRRGTPEVSLSVWKGRSETVYRAPGQVTPNGFSASFRHFGWIDVHYEPGSPKTVAGCRGHSYSSVDGRYTGTFEFHGEWRFTVADYPFLDVRSLPGNALGCDGASTGGAKGATLEALSAYGVTTVIQNKVGGRVRFSAEASYHFGSMQVYRSIEAFGPAGDFVWSPRFRSAKVTPPAPFHGSASFKESRVHFNWRGNLNVDFPGFRGYPLTARPTVAFFGPGVCKVFGPHHHRPPGMCL